MMERLMKKIENVKRKWRCHEVGRFNNSRKD